MLTLAMLLFMVLGWEGPMMRPAEAKPRRSLSRLFKYMNLFARSPAIHRIHIDIVIWNVEAGILACLLKAQDLRQDWLNHRELRDRKHHSIESVNSVFNRNIRAIPGFTLERCAPVIDERQALPFQVLKVQNRSFRESGNVAMLDLLSVEALNPIFQCGATIHAKHRIDDTICAARIRGNLRPIEEGHICAGSAHLVCIK